ncbi:MAG TPA: efflux RND transporter periplasmic adaptor subunit [Bryobacteraceae bacterium]|nr:efflux RND transporter periplasmic adaptor subunit [Bryobacteraceae bacterium]
MTRRILLSFPVVAILVLFAWGVMRFSKIAASPVDTAVPTTSVKRSDVTFTVTARGDLQGGNSEMLVAPMTGGNDMAITYLQEPGALVHAGDVVVRFDTTEQDYKLREAEADLAEAEQKVIQAQADAKATAEEDSYQLESAEAQVKLAELEVRRNPLLAAITARQNDLALESAQNHLAGLKQDSGNHKTTSAAGIAIQEAARNKASVQADTARRNIESMTLRAKTSGYVNIQQNSSGNTLYWGMQLPAYQVGDTVRAGMAVAQIPDLQNWIVAASIGELDRGHLAAGQEAQISVVALPGQTFTGRVKAFGSVTGSPWDRHFDCRIAVDHPSLQLRPGMSANIVITVGTLKNALWLPSQALFESDGRAFVYLETPHGFMPHDVKLVRRSETQAVLTGLSEGQRVAMSNPDQQHKPAPASQGAMKALSR